MTTPLLKSAKKKALTLGIGLSTGYLALSILITVYLGTQYKDRLDPAKNHGAKKALQHIIPARMRK